MDAETARQELLARIAGHQHRLARYLDDVRPRNSRLAVAAIASSSVAAALTAGPAIGGPGFANSTAGLFALSDSSIVWRVLCFFAMLVSILAAVSVNLTNNSAIADRVTAAEACSVELSGLQTLLEFREISPGEAVRTYNAAVARIGFVPGSAPVSPNR